MSLRSKLTITFLVIVLIPLALVTVLTFANYKNSLERIRLSALGDVASFKAARIETCFTGLKADMELAQAFYNIRNNLPILSQLAGNPFDPQFIAAKKMLDEQLQHAQKVLGLIDIMLVNPEGKIVYSSSLEHYSKEFLKNLPDPEQKAFREGKDKVYFSDIYFNKAKGNKPELLVTAPLFDLNDGFAGVIAFEVEMTSIYNFIQDVTGLGNTGETLVGKKIGNEVLYLNPLRHDPDAVLKRRIPIGGEIGVPMQKAVQGGTGSGLQIDYRGKKTIAAWRYISSLDWGIVAKIDTEEAFSDITNLRNLVFAIMGIIFILASMMAFFTAHSISEPIKRLSRGAEIVGSGNLDYQFGVSNLKDEIGQLSMSFDKMTRDLKKVTASRDELNREIIERKETQEKLRENREDLNHAQRVAHTGSWRLNVRKNELTWSDEVYRIFGIADAAPMTYERFVSCIHPDDREFVDRSWQAALKGERYDIEHRIIAAGLVKWVREQAELEFDKLGGLLGGFGTVQDITERKKGEEDLKRSNENLEQFAYVASHDLQEPLRMMASYSELLERRYKDKLDTDADEFIGYIVDGAKRMQKLINDLLAYSRVGRADKALKKVDCNAIAHKVIDYMSKREEENKPVITHDDLPVLMGNENNFIQLFQNLIGNAIKFRGSDMPRIHISAIKKESEWLFSIKDNGIGIEPEYRDRIFLIFQRLHGRDKYEGTGIGLSICKKIVETQGGKIWVDSEFGKGSTFYFTVPVRMEVT